MMSDRKKYPHNGIYKFENFVENVLNNRGRIRLDFAVGGIEKWYLKIRTETDEKGVLCCSPTISCNIAAEQVKLDFCVFFKILNNNNLYMIASWEKNELIDFGASYLSGEKLRMPDAMNEEYGWLDNGALRVEVGIHVESIQRLDGIRNFNFYDEIFDSTEKCDMITLTLKNDEKSLHCHKKLLNFHSPYFSDVRNKIFGFPKNYSIDIHYIKHVLRFDQLEKFLQIAHGVQLEIQYEDIFPIMYMAHRLQLRNVIRYCERQLIENMNLQKLTTGDFGRAFIYSLYRYQVHILKRVTKWETMRHILQEIEAKNKIIQKMTSQSMKMLAHKIFSDFC